MKNKPIRPERKCDGNTEWSYFRGSEIYNPDADRQFNINDTNNIFELP